MVTVEGKPEQSAADWVLTTTRSVRKGLDTTREVPRELIADCLRVAMQAPGASNAFYPQFVVVTDQARRTALAEVYKRACDIYISSPGSAANMHFEDPVHEAQQPRVVASVVHLAEHLAEVPALVIPCISPRADGLPVDAQAGLWGSVLPAAWSFMLAARARGLASAWTTIHLMFEDEVAAILDIDHAQVMQAAMIPIAYSLRKNFKPAYREPIEKFTHWDRW
jgi:nitroreductase